MKIANSQGYGQKKVSGRSISARTSSKMTSIEHNNRTTEARTKLKDYGNHVDWSKTKDNVILKSEDIKDVYENVFHDSVIQYNKKQKRKDRRIDSTKGGYLKKIQSESKNGALDPQREYIVQFGTKEDKPLPEDVTNQMFKEYLDNFEKRYPDLHVYNAVIHNDEATAHMHVNFVPVAEGYKTGMSKRPSFSRILKNHNINFKEFFEGERDVLEKVMKQHTGEARKKVGTHKYLKPQQYREVMQKADEYRNRIGQEADEILDEAEHEAREIINNANIKAKSSTGMTKFELDRREIEINKQDLINRQNKKELKDYEDRLNTRDENYHTTVQKFNNTVQIYKSKLEEQKERQQKELKEQKKRNEQELKKREDAVTLRETTVKERESLLNTREREINQKDLEADKKLQEASRLQEIANDMMEQAKHQVEKAKQEIKAIKNRLTESWQRVIDMVRHGDLEPKKVEKTVKKYDPITTDKMEPLSLDLDDLSQSKNNGIQR